MRRREFIKVIGGATATWPLAARAQQARPARVRRIGFLIGNEPSLIAAFKNELGRLGYVDGENLIVETRVSRPNSSDLVAQVAELTHIDLDLIVAAALPQALQVRKADPAMPMVIATCPGMISNGFATSLEHPGGNATGMDELPPGVTAKRLTLLKTAAPHVSRIALLSTTPGRGGHEAQLTDAEQAAGRLAVSVKPYRVTSFSELEPALTAMVDDRMNGLVNFQGGLPAMYQATLFADAGGLMAWAPDLEGQFQVAARYVDQILRGAKPGDLPIQYPPRYYLTVNAGAAARLGLALPPALLSQADRILP
jgi:putative ABC transport system substrate-binding protein